uniref:ATP-dependent DNA helicase Q4 n=1 Tax=Rhipicephalus appendiculatus TaxID=34631 RepID=A0A131YSX8_RHIAP
MKEENSVSQSCEETLWYTMVLESEYHNTAALNRVQHQAHYFSTFPFPFQQEQCLNHLRQEIRNLVTQHRDHSFNGRAVARIFHGIGSPCFPAQVWGRVRRFWRGFLDVDFNTIVTIANKELLSLR